MNDTIRIWQAAGFPTISHSRIQIKFKDVGDKFEGAKKTAYVRQKGTTLVSEDWLDKLFDIRTYTYKISQNPKIFKRFYVAAHGKTIPKKELPFLSDQRTKRKVILATRRTRFFPEKRLQQSGELKRRSNEEEILEQPFTNKHDRRGNVMPSKSRKLQPAVTINDGCSSFSEEGDIEFELKKMTGGKG